MDTKTYEEWGYDEQQVKSEEFWYVCTVRDASEVIMSPLYGAQRFFDDLTEEAKARLIKVINNK